MKQFDERGLRHALVARNRRRLDRRLRAPSVGRFGNVGSRGSRLRRQLEHGRVRRRRRPRHGAHVSAVDDEIPTLIQRPELHVGLPLEHGKGACIAPVHLGNERLDRSGASQHRSHLARSRRQLYLVERLEVRWVGRYDAQCVGFGVEGHRTHTDLLREALRNHRDEGARYIGLRELLRRDEMRLVMCGQRLEHLGLGHQSKLENGLLDALTGPLQTSGDPVELIGLEEVVVQELIDDDLRFGQRRSGGRVGHDRSNSLSGLAMATRSTH